MKNNKKNLSVQENEDFGFWQSYSDLMSALLLVFVLVMSSILLQSMTLYQEKISEEEKVQLELEQQQELLENQQELLEQQQKKIDNRVGVKESIIQNLSDEFSKTNLVINVDPNDGSITFDANILFTTDSFELTDEGKAYLNDFIPVYFNALLSNDFSEYIAEIIIEGNTDTNGSYMYNLELSQKRALAVCQYCLENINVDSISNNFDINTIRKILTANGRSWSNPIYNSDGSVNMDASRRVEFKFRLKDDEMISQMKGILENE